MKSLILAVFISFIALSRASFSYKNYRIYNVVPSSAEQVNSLVNLKDQGYFDFWTQVFDVGSEVRIMISPAEDEQFQAYSKSAGLNATISVTNVQDLVEGQLIPATNARASRLLSFSWDRYHNLQEIYAWLDELESNYPNSVRTVTIGTTYEGNPIKGVVIDLQGSARQGTPLVGMIEGGIHAREWISPATVTWIIKEFLTSTDPDVKFMAEALVWHIFPVTNPDGYAHTWNSFRLWRKNRNPDNFVACANADLGNGIDLNRNFDYLWMSIGASQNPCDNTYAGPQGTSEREAQAITSYVTQIQNTGEMIYYFAFHSYSQMILVPFSHLYGIDVLQADNYADMFEIAIRGAEKLEARHGTPYQVGTSAEILYPVSGSSFDWVKGVAKVPIVYLFELRDVGRHGFLLPTNQIVPNNEEIMDCLVEMEKTTRRLGYYTAGAAHIVSSVLVLVVGVMLAVFG